MPRVIEIEIAGSAGRARRLRLDDGSVRTTSAAIVKTLGLEAGSEVSDVEALVAPLEPDAARERALALLGYRDRSEGELADKLRADGYPVEVVDEIVSAYRRVGLLDDARFAEHYVATRIAAGYGRSRIRRELEQRGVDSDVAEAALDAASTDDDELARARTALRGARPQTRAERDRCLRRLVSKGFGFSVAKRALEVECSCDPDMD